MSPLPQDLNGITAGAARALKEIARQHGYPSAEAYLDDLDVRDQRTRQALDEARDAPLTAVHQTDLGTMYHGNALTYMQAQAEESHDLIMTSPP
ncbi:MAG TPA: hypothetical protein DD685_13080, partial [Halomonas sp.]|nr:hypothetical protein [Halomonas sp.]